MAFARMWLDRWLAAACLSVIAGVSCADDRAKDMPRHPVVDHGGSLAADSVVVLYYRPEDCFTCYGVLGHWSELSRASGLEVWLALDDAPMEDALKGLRRMRLPFRVGIVSTMDSHRHRPSETVKEVLFVGGVPIDSALVQLGAVRSGLIDRLEAASNAQARSSGS